jgi:GxxExxY protein
MPAQDHGRDEQTYAIIGAAMEVHRVLGHGFVEAPYAASLRIELRRRAIPFSAEVTYPLRYKGEPLELSYRPDLICFETIVVEVKALPGIGGTEVGQVINYLRASGLCTGFCSTSGPEASGSGASYSVTCRSLPLGSSPA